MNRIMPRVLLIAAAIGAATCCPSLFLTVTKGDPSPLLGLPEPVPAYVPLMRPLDIDNRFDIFEGNVGPSKFDDFQDIYVGPRGMTSTRSLEAITDKFGDPFSVGVYQEIKDVDACVICVSKGLCKALMFRKAPFDYQLHPVVLVPGEVGPSPMVVAAQAFAAGTESNQGCDPHPGDTTAVLDRPLKAVTAFQRLKVSLNLPTTETIAGFVHVSDVQIRDPDIRVGDRVLSHHLDKLISSFEYDRDLEVYNRYVVHSLFATINQIHKVMPEIGFVIHTGDATDSGVTTELREFHRLYDTLELPSYDVLGNHDVLIFGNMLTTGTDHDETCITASSEIASGSEKLAFLGHVLPHKICIKATIVCPSCLPGEAAFVSGATHEESHANFMAAFAQHSEADVLEEPDPPVEHDEDQTYCFARDKKNPQANPPYSEIRIQATTRQHGFDLNSVIGANNPPGYYAFANDIQVGREPRHALNIVLDTNDLDKDEGGQTGRINTLQLHWLKATLDCVKTSHPRDLVFVFGHHGLHETKPPAGVTESIHSVLAASNNVVGYFYGHDHAHGICRAGGPCQGFWEVMTGSMIEFPQEARLVRVKYAGKGLGFLELLTFGESLENGDDELGKAVELGHRGARHDYCANHEPGRCSDDLRPYRDDARHTNARLFFRLPEFKARAASPQQARRATAPPAPRAE